MNRKSFVINNSSAPSYVYGSFSNLEQLSVAFGMRSLPRYILAMN